MKIAFLILLPAIIMGLLFYYYPIIGSILLLIAILVLFYINYPTILTLLGQRQYALGNNTKALKILKKAHDKSKRGVNPSVVYAYILLRCGNPGEASKVLNYVLLNPKLKQNERNYVLQNLSLVKYRQGDMQEAVRLMSEVFENYKSSSVYGALGYYKILANSSDAEEFCKEAYEYNSDDKVIVDNLVQIYLSKKDYAGAKELSQKSIDLGNTGVELYYHAGQAALGLGDIELAKQHFYKAMSCQRSFMTTVSAEEIEQALESITEKEDNEIGNE